MLRHLAAIALLLAFAAAPDARAQSMDQRSSPDQQWSWCRDAKNRDLAIGGCTALIQSGKLGSTELSLAFTGRGEAYANADQPEAAIADYDQAIHLNADNAASWYGRGRAYSRMGQYQRAIADFDQAVRLNPNSGAAFNARGNVFERLGKHERAIADFEQAIRLDPGDAQAFTDRGNAYSSMGHNDRALTDYDHAIGLNPANAEAFNGRGRAYAAKGLFDTAIENFDQAAKIDPNSADTFNNRGNAYSGKGQFQQAIADYDQAIGLNPEFADAFNNRGNAYQHLGQSARALADFQQAARLNPAAYGRGAKVQGAGNDYQDGNSWLAMLLRPYLHAAVLVPALLLIGYGVRKTNGRWLSPALWIGFFTGGALGVIATFAEQMLSGMLHARASDTVGAAAYEAFLAIALPEEVLKFAAVLLITLLFLEGRRLQDVLLLAIGLGMGFALVENIFALWHARGFEPDAIEHAVAAVPAQGILGLTMGVLIVAAVLSEGNRWASLGLAFCVPLLLHGTFATIDLLSNGSLNWTLLAAMLAMASGGLLAVGLCNIVLPDAAVFDGSDGSAANSETPRLLSRLAGGFLVTMLAVAQYSDLNPFVCWMAALLGVLPLILACDMLFVSPQASRDLDRRAHRQR